MPRKNRPRSASSGGNARQQKAKAKITQLVGQGYRLNPNATTSTHYKTQVATSQFKNRGGGVDGKKFAQQMDKVARGTMRGTAPRKKK